MWFFLNLRFLVFTSSLFIPYFTERLICKFPEVRLRPYIEIESMKLFQAGINFDWIC